MNQYKVPESVKAIIFDMDGVLINSEPLHFRIWKQVFAEKGLEIDYEHYKGCIGSTLGFLCELIYNGYGADFRGDPSIASRFKELKEEYIEKEGVPAIAGVGETLSKLKERGYQMAIASSSPQEYIEYCMKKLGLSDYFKVIFSGERVANPKPAPDVFLAAASAIGVSPASCLVIEDSTNGSRAAHAAGMQCLGFANPDSGEQDLSLAQASFYPFCALYDFFQV